MKYNKLLYIVFIFAAFVGCEEDYEPINDYSDCDFYTSLFGAQEVQIAVGDYMSFSDLSQGVLTHEWSVADTSGIKFLTGTLTSKTKDYYPFIDETMGLSTDKKTISVLYTKPGNQVVRLYDTFSEYVKFDGRNDTLEAKLKGGIWVIDTSFVVQVFDSIQVAMKVMNGDLEIANLAYDEYPLLKDSVSWPEVEVMSGESLSFVDLTERGTPTGRTWSFKKANPATSTDSIASVKYLNLGTYYASLTSERSSDSEDFPSDSQKKNIPIRIKVIPSDQPLIASNIVEDKSETIHLDASGLLDKISGAEGDFTVHVSNASGFDSDVAVKSVTRNADNNSQIDIELGAPIYNSDLITISYNGESIQSLDGRALTTFSDVTVAMYNPNLLNEEFYNAEGAGSWLAAPTTGLTLTKDTENVSEGNASHKIEYTASKTQLYPSKDSFDVTGFPMEIGTSYHFEYDVYIKDALPAKWQIRLAEAEDELGNYYGITEATASIEGLKADAWNTITHDFVSPKGAEVMKLGIKLFAPGIYYYDNFSLKVVEVRPAE